MSKRLARIQIANDLLRHALHFPLNADIRRVYDTGRYLEFEILVRHPDFPVVEDGADIPLIEPTVTHEPERYTIDWNLPVVSDE